MPKSTWRPWAGAAFAALGGLLLLWSLGRPPAPPGPGPFDLTLAFAGQTLLRLPVSPEAMAALLWLRWLLVPLAPLLLGAFLLFLETPRGRRAEEKILGWIERVREWERRE